MKVDWTKTVEGVPLKVVRDMMRDLRRGYPTRERIAATTCEHIVKAGRRWSSDQVMPVRSSDDVDFILTELVPKGRLPAIEPRKKICPGCRALSSAATVVDPDRSRCPTRTRSFTTRSRCR
jgi:hypothetical protein